MEIGNFRIFIQETLPRNDRFDANENGDEVYTTLIVTDSSFEKNCRAYILMGETQLTRLDCFGFRMFQNCV